MPGGLVVPWGGGKMVDGCSFSTKSFVKKLLGGFVVPWGAGKMVDGCSFSTKSFVSVPSGRGKLSNLSSLGFSSPFSLVVK